MDREKVIKGIHQHCEGSMFDRCGECPYYEIDHEPFVCRDMLLNDLNELLKEQEDLGTELTNAVELIHKKNERIEKLLKEQEAVEPKHNPLSPTDWFCGKCGMCISRFHDYCPSCGQAVKWE